GLDIKKFAVRAGTLVKFDGINNSVPEYLLKNTIVQAAQKSGIQGVDINLIEVAHRVRKLKKHCTVIAKFYSREVVHASLVNRKFIYKATNESVYEDVTKRDLEVLYLLRRNLPPERKRDVFTRGGRVIIKNDAGKLVYVRDKYQANQVLDEYQTNSSQQSQVQSLNSLNVPLNLNETS
ncbi:unnamed protein product, partial [Didymodactylos carnosus]